MASVVLTAAQKALLADVATGQEQLVRVWTGNEYRWQYKGKNVTRVARSLIRKALLNPKYPEVGGEAGVSMRGEAVAKQILEQIESARKNAPAETAKKRGRRRKALTQPNEPGIDRPARGYAAHGQRKLVTASAH